MKTIDKLFVMDNEQKELIQKISALCGIKQDIIKQVWQYTIFNLLLQLLENKDKTLNTIQIPFFGKVVVRPDQEVKGEFEAFLALNPNFRETIKTIKAGNETGLIAFFQENFINKILDNFTDEE